MAAARSSNLVSLVISFKAAVAHMSFMRCGTASWIAECIAALLSMARRLGKPP